MSLIPLKFCSLIFSVSQKLLLIIFLDILAFNSSKLINNLGTNSNITDILINSNMIFNSKNFQGKEPNKAINKTNAKIIIALIIKNDLIISKNS